MAGRQKNTKFNYSWRPIFNRTVVNILLQKVSHYQESSLNRLINVSEANFFINSEHIYRYVCIKYSMRL